MSVPVPRPASEPDTETTARPPANDAALPPPAPVPPRASPDDALSRFRVALGMVMGFGLLAATNAVAIVIAVPWPRGGVLVRLAHHGFDAAETIGLGSLAALFVGLWCRFVRA